MGNIIIVKDSSLIALPKDKKINYYMYNIQSIKKSIKELEGIKKVYMVKNIYKAARINERKRSSLWFFLSL